MKLLKFGLKRMLTGIGQGQKVKSWYSLTSYGGENYKLQRSWKHWYRNLTKWLICSNNLFLLTEIRTMGLVFMYRTGPIHFQPEKSGYLSPIRKKVRFVLTSEYFLSAEFHYSK